MYEITLTDSAGAHVLPPLEIPLTRVYNEKMTTVEALSGNIYDEYIATKRAWSHTWRYLSKEEYDLLDEIYTRMKDEGTYPDVTISGEGVTNLTVKYTLGAKNIIDDCGMVEGVSISLIETRQL